MYVLCDRETIRCPYSHSLSPSVNCLLPSLNLPPSLPPSLSLSLSLSVSLSVNCLSPSLYLSASLSLCVNYLSPSLLPLSKLPASQSLSPSMPFSVLSSPLFFSPSPLSTSFPLPLVSLSHSLPLSLSPSLSLCGTQPNGSVIHHNSLHWL